MKFFRQLKNNLMQDNLKNASIRITLCFILSIMFLFMIEVLFNTIIPFPLNSILMCGFYIILIHKTYEIKQINKKEKKDFSRRLKLY
jgi:ABC-type bacteriocin/lantibiotic exporter with double-glycine peptidase domain